MALPEVVEIDEQDLKFPSMGILVMTGPSKCGKTRSLSRIVLNPRVCFGDEAPERWIIIYKYWQKLYEDLQSQLGLDRVTFIQHCHSNLLDELGISSRDESQPSIGLILDDLCENISADPAALSMFSGGAHHYSLFLVYVTQFLYLNNEIQRQAMRQASHLICFDNVKHRSGLKTLSQQIFQNSSFLPEAMQDLHKAKGPYHYLQLDLRPYLEKECLRCRSGPFQVPEDITMYTPRKSCNMYKYK